MPDALHSDAAVPTPTPARFVKQLASHLGRHCEVQEEAAGTRLVFAYGECLLAASDGTLDMHATAAGQEDLDHVTRVVGSHLERFGQRGELVVSWQQRP